MTNFNITDNNGNKYYTVKNEVRLILKSDKRERRIGEFINHTKAGLVYKKNEDESQIYRKTNSWSIPVVIYEIVDSIWFYTKDHNYTIIKEDVKDKIEYFHFLSSGTEKKVYIPLEYWKKTNR